VAGRRPGRVGRRPTDITFNRLEAAARRDRGVLRDVTIKRRLSFWRAAVQYAGDARGGGGQGGGARDAAVAARRRPARDGLLHAGPVPGVSPGGAPGDASGGSRSWASGRGCTPSTSPMTTSAATWTSTTRWEGSDSRGRWWRRNHKNLRVRGPARRASSPAGFRWKPEVRELAAGVAGGARATPRPAGGGRAHEQRAPGRSTAAAARANLPPVRPNLGLRASHSSLLLARGYSYEYVRIVLGHVRRGPAPTRSAITWSRARRSTGRP
jgi:hypothetical protein